MYAKIRITGALEVITGLHIGGSDVFSPIGAVDSPIIKDPITGYPVIPGSSLKGKIRTLLSRKYSPDAKTPLNDNEQFLRIFGGSGKQNAKVGKLIFSDMVLSNWDEMKKKGANSRTEIKFENTINRLTGMATPRQIERAIKGSVFLIDLVYEATEEKDTKEDFKILAEGLKMLEFDYLGGQGTRGYGKVKFHNLKVERAIGEVENVLLEECQKILEKYRV